MSKFYLLQLRHLYSIRVLFIYFDNSSQLYIRRDAQGDNHKLLRLLKDNSGAFQLRGKRSIHKAQRFIHGSRCKSFLQIYFPFDENKQFVDLTNLTLNRFINTISHIDWFTNSHKQPLTLVGSRWLLCDGNRNAIRSQSHPKPKKMELIIVD